MLTNLLAFRGMQGLYNAWSERIEIPYGDLSIWKVYISPQTGDSQSPCFLWLCANHAHIYNAAGHNSTKLFQLVGFHILFDVERVQMKKKKKTRILNASRMHWQSDTLRMNIALVRDRQLNTDSLKKIDRSVRPLSSFYIATLSWISTCARPFSENHTGK